MFTGPNIITDGLVLYLDAANTKSYPGSGTTWSDLSGNGNNGTLVNGPTFNSTNGGSIVFDGVNDYAVINSPLSYLLPSSTEVLFSVNNFTTNNTVIGGYDQGYDNNFSSAIIGMIFITNSSKKIVSSVITTTQIYRTVTSTTTLTEGKYYHVILNKDTVNGLLQLYVNGVLESSITFDTASYAQWPTLGNFRGSNVIRLSDTLSSNSIFNTTKYLNGRIPIFKLYNRILSASEILQNYNATKGRFNL